jgi:hypothetical protein
MPSFAQDPLDRFRNLGILARHDLRSGFDDGDAAAEPPVGLGRFETE